MKNFILGVCFGTIGVTLLSTVSDIVVNGTELIKAKIGVEISKYNDQINELSTPKTQTRAIGFATTNVEEDNYEE